MVNMSLKVQAMADAVHHSPTTSAHRTVKKENKIEKPKKAAVSSYHGVIPAQSNSMISIMFNRGGAVFPKRMVNDMKGSYSPQVFLRKQIFNKVGFLTTKM